MLKVYILLIIIGFIGIACVSMFGIAGAYSLNLGFFLYFVSKGKPDEREQQLIRKVWNTTFGLIMVILINIYVLSHHIEFGSFLTKNWIGLLVSSFFIILGISGIIILKKD